MMRGCLDCSTAGPFKVHDVCPVLEKHDAMSLLQMGRDGAVVRALSST